MTRINAQLTSIRFISRPWITRRTRITAAINIVSQPMIFRMAAVRVLSSSSEKTGGAKNRRNAFCILLLLLFSALCGSGPFKELNGDFRIAQNAADLSDRGLKDLLVLSRSTDCRSVEHTSELQSHSFIS